MVPAEDRALQRAAENAIFRGVDDRGELRLRLFGPDAIGHVEQDALPGHHTSGGIFHRGVLILNPDIAAVCSSMAVFRVEGVLVRTGLRICRRDPLAVLGMDQIGPALVGDERLRLVSPQSTT